MKEIMKQKILIFIAGVLVGAVLTAGIFCIARKVGHKNEPRQMHQEQRKNFKGNGYIRENRNERPGERNQDNNNNQEQGQKPEVPNTNTQNQNTKS